jgi:hypothetical protein
MLELFKKNKRGELPTGAAVASTITLIVGVGIATLVLIFVGTLGGSTYNLAEPDINSLAVRYSTVATFVYLENESYLGYDGLERGSFDIYNVTGNVSVPESAFVIDYQHGYIRTADAAGLYNGSEMNISFIQGDSQILANVKGSVTNAFKAQSQTAAYLPLIVLAVVITLVLALVLGMGAGLGGMNGGRGGAL